MKYDLTVIIPTLNEAEIIRDTIDYVEGVFKKSGLNGEILVVDDNSRDGTPGIVNELQREWKNLSILVRHQNPGLSPSTVDGFVVAASDIMVVMDADLQHPPEKIPELFEKIKQGYDIAIGSRYMEGGGIQGWGIDRQIISRGATFLARLFFPAITDPVSGFFAVRRLVITHAPLKPKGYKILVEILSKGNYTRVAEVPYIFQKRKLGTSKLKQQTIKDYLGQLADLMKYSWEHHNSPAYTEFLRVGKFMIVGLSGMLVNLGLLFYLTEFWGIYFLFSGMIAIECSIITNFILNDVWTFGDCKENKHGWGMRLILFQAVSLAGVIINLSLLYILTTGFGIYYLVSSLIGIFCAFSWNFLANRRFTWKKS